MTTVAIVLLVLLAVCFVIAKRKPAGGPGVVGLNVRKSPRKSTKSSITPKNHWGATSIFHDEKACDAVKAITGNRYLDSERNIPRLPLPDCDATQCNCRYARHEDRRDDTEDRRSLYRLQAELYDLTGEVSRRTRRRGRRKGDWA